MKNRLIVPHERPPDTDAPVASTERLGGLLHSCRPRRPAGALSLFERLPNVRSAPVQEAKVLFARWKEEAVAALREWDKRTDVKTGEVRQRQIEAFSRLAAEDALDDLVEVGLLPAGIAQRAN